MAREAWTVTRHPSRGSLPPTRTLVTDDDPVTTVLALDVPWYLDGRCADESATRALLHLVHSDARSVTALYAQSLIQDVTAWVDALRSVLPGASDDALVTVAVDYDNWNFSPTDAVLAAIGDGLQPHVAYLRLVPESDHALVAG